MVTPRSHKLEVYTVLALLLAVFAVLVLGNELLSIHNRVPGGNYPIEHHDSWTRVWIFFGTAVVSLLLVWGFHRSERRLADLPSPKAVLGLALVPLGLSLFAGHYLSSLGWCCEVVLSLSYFFGFPFSFLLGNHGTDNAILDSVRRGVYADYTIVDALTRPGLVYSWSFRLYPFFLDLLFWANAVLICLSLLYLLRRRIATRTPAGEAASSAGRLLRKVK